MEAGDTRRRLHMAREGQKKCISTGGADELLADIHDNFEIEADALVIVGA